jgi:hypothetical protein
MANDFRRLSNEANDVGQFYDRIVVSKSIKNSRPFSQLSEPSIYIGLN